jgi:hypothetical protein
MSYFLLVAFCIAFLFWSISMMVGLGIIRGGPIKRWYHDRLGWHDGNGEVWFDGASLHSVCSQCGKEVKQDSQGNWF